MDNKRAVPIALVVIGLFAINFFYLSDLIIVHTSEPGIIIGWRSAVAIGVANLISIVGILAAMNSRNDDS
ncbi:MAG: hypothetical protein ACKVJQ_07410 [Alphaproteobacteria bacterium]|jgi:hypothetical protein